MWRCLFVTEEWISIIITAWKIDIDEKLLFEAYHSHYIMYFLPVLFSLFIILYF